MFITKDIYWLYLMEVCRYGCSGHIPGTVSDGKIITNVGLNKIMEIKK